MTSLAASVAKVRLPRYVRVKRLRSKQDAYFWERPTWAKPPAEKYGRLCHVDSEALGTDLPAAIAKADLLNQHLDEWRTGVEGKPSEGSIKALFGWYRATDRFTEMGFRSRRDYRHYMAILEAFPLRTTVFGERRAVEIEAGHADALYRALVKARGKRAGAYCMQICRRIWNEAIRAKKAKAPNPFSRMGIKMVAAKGNRATTRAEFDAFRAKAREMGRPSMAAAAAVSFELVRRATDVFGYIFEPGDEARGFFWEDYRPGREVAMRQGKTGDSQIIPLVDDDGVSLYPALEEELGALSRGAGHMIVSEDTGKRYDETEAIRTFRKIAAAAGLPKEMTFTGFRHGGATELGDAGVQDIRAISGHRTLQQTATYNKATEAKARSAGQKRRAHVAGKRTPKRTNDAEDGPESGVA